VKYGAVYVWIGENQYHVCCYLEREKKAKIPCVLKTRLVQIKIPVYTKNSVQQRNTRRR
jgi:hypothetical protein